MVVVERVGGVTTTTGADAGGVLGSVMSEDNGAFVSSLLPRSFCGCIDGTLDGIILIVGDEVSIEVGTVLGITLMVGDGIVTVLSGASRRR